MLTQAYAHQCFAYATGPYKDPNTKHKHGGLKRGSCSRNWGYTMVYPIFRDILDILHHASPIMGLSGNLQETKLFPCPASFFPDPFRQKSALQPPELHGIAPRAHSPLSRSAPGAMGTPVFEELSWWPWGGRDVRHPIYFGHVNCCT